MMKGPALRIGRQRLAEQCGQTGARVGRIGGRGQSPGPAIVALPLEAIQSSLHQPGLGFEVILHQAQRNTRFGRHRAQ
jgi:hypothetical protein